MGTGRYEFLKPDGYGGIGTILKKVMHIHTDITPKKHTARM